MMKKTTIAFLLNGLLVSNAMASGFESNVNSLHYAASINEADYVKELVQEEPNLASQFNDEGLTPLHVAIKKSSLTSLSVLLDQKINPNIKNSSGETVLIYAIKNGHPKAASLLLKKGAKTGIKDKTGKTAKDYAKEKGISYLKLFEKEMPKKNDDTEHSNKLVTKDFFEKYKNEVDEKFKKLKEDNEKIIGSLELKLISVNKDIIDIKDSYLKFEKQLQTYESDVMELKEELNGTDLSLLDLEQKVGKMDDSFVLVKKSLLNLESKTDSISTDLTKYSNAQMIQMYGSLKEEPQAEFNLLGSESKDSVVISEEPELEFLSLGESTNVEIKEQEDSLNLIK